MDPDATYRVQRKRMALKVARSKGIPPPYDDEIWDPVYLEPVPCGKVTERGLFRCDSCRRDMMDGAKKDHRTKEEVGNVINEHDHKNGRARENDICPSCNTGARKTTDDVKGHVDKKAMRQFGPCLLVALGGRKVAAATSADRDLVARALKAAAAADSAYDRHFADADAAAPQGERRAAGGGLRRRGAASASPPPSRRRTSGQAPISPAGSEGSQLSRASAAPSRASSAGSGHSLASQRVRQVLRVPGSARRRRRSLLSQPRESPAKRHRSSSRAARGAAAREAAAREAAAREADATARGLVEGTLPAVTSVRSMLSAIASSGPSFLAGDAAALDASLDAFLEKARRS